MADADQQDPAVAPVQSRQRALGAERIVKRHMRRQGFAPRAPMAAKETAG